jgi:quercetin dioxygenase-like cupin family protein
MRAWNNRTVNLGDEGTHFGYVADGRISLSCAAGLFDIGTGLYFSVPGPAVIAAENGKGFTCTRLGYWGMFALGGPIECEGRLRYIDGATDSLLLAPVLKGDPCLNMLHLPAGINQTAHTHPTDRIGLIVSGLGTCRTLDASFDLLPGNVFVLAAGTIHSFHTNDSDLRLVVYHPDSDFGPSHDDHPMLNRTLVSGVSAALLDDLRTRG